MLIIGKGPQFYTCPGASAEYGVGIKECMGAAGQPTNPFRKGAATVTDGHCKGHNRVKQEQLAGQLLLQMWET